MYIKVSNGSNDTQAALDLTNIEQWRVSLGARSVSQSSTPGTLQNARNTYGTLPLSLTLMVRGGSKEKNRALCSRIVSRLHGKVEIGELEGYDNLVFIGSVKSYSINAQCGRWYTITLVIECEAWMTGDLPIVMTNYDGTEEYDVNDPIVVEPLYTRSWTTRILKEKRTGVYADMPGILPTPISFRLTTTELLPEFAIEATSDDTPENNWTIRFENLPAMSEGKPVTFDLTAPLPGSDKAFGFALWYNAATPEIPVIVNLDPDGIVTEITGWPVYAGGTMTLKIIYTGDMGDEPVTTLTFGVSALQAL